MPHHLLIIDDDQSLLELYQLILDRVLLIAEVA